MANSRIYVNYKSLIFLKEIRLNMCICMCDAPLLITSDIRHASKPICSFDLSTGLSDAVLAWCFWMYQAIFRAVVPNSDQRVDLKF